jgi:F-type H+-transporting ATPase subunit b
MMRGNLSDFLILASSGEKPDPMKFDIDLAIFTFVIFVGLLFVLTRYAWKPLMDGLNQRETSIADKIAAAAQAQEKAQASLRQYEQKLESVNDEASAILAEARKDGVAAKEKIVAEAQAEAHRQREKALADIKAARDQAVRELAEKSADSAVSLASSIVGRSLDKSDHSRLIEDSIKRFTTGA